jgi:hypothetical protein
MAGGGGASLPRREAWLEVSGLVTRWPIPIRSRCGVNSPTIALCPPRACRQPARRSFASGTKITRSTASSGGEVISTIALSPSRSSSTPPQAPAGMPSIGSVSSTRSKVVISWSVGMAWILEPRVGGNQARRGGCVLVVPGGSYPGGSRSNGQLRFDAADDAVCTMIYDLVNLGVKHGLENRLPYALDVGRLYAKYSRPFLSVSAVGQDPLIPLLGVEYASAALGRGCPMLGFGMAPGIEQAGYPSTPRHPAVRSPRRGLAPVGAGRPCPAAEHGSILPPRQLS